MVCAVFPDRMRGVKPSRDIIDADTGEIIAEKGKKIMPRLVKKMLDEGLITEAEFKKLYFYNSLPLYKLRYFRGCQKVGSPKKLRFCIVNRGKCSFLKLLICFSLEPDGLGRGSTFRFYHTFLKNAILLNKWLRVSY